LIPKQFTADSFAMLLLLAAAFAMGSFVGGSAPLHTPAEASFRRTTGSWPRPWSLLEFLFVVSFWLAIAGYAVWMATSVARGLSPQSLVRVLTGGAGGLLAMKSLTATVPGVTTLTQCAIPAVLLGVIKGAVTGWGGVRGKILLLVFLAAVRSFLHTERLALLEVVIPCALLYMHLRTNRPGYRPSFRRRVALALAPVAAVLLVFACFIGFEYFRSWSSYYRHSGLSLFEFGVLRLGGYYVTSLNNGAMMLQHADAPLPLPYYTLEWFWKFPVIGRLFDYSQCAGLLPTNLFKYLISTEANIEFNSRCGIFMPWLDFGTAGGVMFWLWMGLAGGFLHRCFSEGQLFGLACYPVFYLGLLETPRILYWFEGRAFPLWVVLLPLAVATLHAHCRAPAGVSPAAS